MFELKMKIVILSFLFISGASVAQTNYRSVDTLAIVGNRTITLDEFQTYYKEKLRKIGLTDNGDTRTKYLQNLVDDELLLLDAKKRGVDKTKSALVELERIKTQELLNAFSKRFIEPTVKVTEQDVQQMYIKMNTKIKVKHLYASTLEEAEKLFGGPTITALFADKDTVEVAKPKGCAKCGDSGYRGRVGIYEILENSPAIQTLIVERASSEKIEEQAKKEGMTSVVEDGVRKILSKETTIEELVRVMQE